MNLRNLLDWKKKSKVKSAFRYYYGIYTFSFAIKSSCLSRFEVSIVKCSKNVPRIIWLLPLKILNFQWILDSFAIRHVCSQSLSFLFLYFKMILFFVVLVLASILILIQYVFFFLVCLRHFVLSFSVAATCLCCIELLRCDMNFTALTWHWYHWFLDDRKQ